jgi:hypothetical protein
LYLLNRNISENYFQLCNVAILRFIGLILNFAKKKKKYLYLAFTLPEVAESFGEVSAQAGPQINSPPNIHTGWLTHSTLTKLNSFRAYTYSNCIS